MKRWDRHADEQRRMQRRLRTLCTRARRRKRRTKARRKLVERDGAHCLELLLVKSARTHPSAANCWDLQARADEATAPNRRNKGVEVRVGR